MLAERYGFGPDTVAGMSDAQILMYLGGGRRSRTLSYKELFYRTWSTRRRCVRCDKYAGKSTDFCGCGGDLRAFTRDEIDREWERYRAEKQAREAKKKTRRKG